MRTAENHCKEYYVKVDKAFDDEFIRRMGEGVPILGKITRKCKIWRIDKDTFGIELMQGLNRQIRRMCEYFGYKVLELKRVRIENVKLGNLLEGEYRIIKGEELEELRKRVIPDE